MGLKYFDLFSCSRCISSFFKKLKIALQTTDTLYFECFINLHKNAIKVVYSLSYYYMVGKILYSIYQSKIFKIKVQRKRLQWTAKNCFYAWIFQECEFSVDHYFSILYYEPKVNKISWKMPWTSTSFDHVLSNLIFSLLFCVLKFYQKWIESWKRYEKSQKCLRWFSWEKEGLCKPLIQQFVSSVHLNIKFFYQP